MLIQSQIYIYNIIELTKKPSQGIIVILFYLKVKKLKEQKIDSFAFQV